MSLLNQSSILFLDRHGNPIYSDDPIEKIEKAKREEEEEDTKDSFYAKVDPTYYVRKYTWTREAQKSWDEIDNFKYYRPHEKKTSEEPSIPPLPYNTDESDISESDFDDNEETQLLVASDPLQQIRPTEKVCFDNVEDVTPIKWNDCFTPEHELNFPLSTELHQVAHMAQGLMLGGNRGKGKNRPKKQFSKRGKPKRKLVSGLPKNLKPNDIMRPSFRTALNYFDPVMQVSAPTQSFVVRSIRINDYYDPDPAALTTGYAGFADLMSFYEFFRVDHTQVIWEPSNNETFQVAVGYVFSQTNLSLTLTTRQLAIDALENGISSKPYSLQQRNGGKSDCSIVRSLNCKALLGDPSLYNGDVSYTGTAVASPADQLWVNLIVVSPTNLTLLLNGIVGALTLRSRGLLFGRITLDDPKYAEHRLRPFTSEQLTTALKLASEREANRSIDKRRLK